MKKLIALLMAAVMLFALCACGAKTEESAEPETPATETQPAAEVAPVEEAEEAAPDTITCLLPPVMADYGDYVREAAKEYCQDHPNITIEVTDTTWNDHTEKLSTMALAGEAPDISEIDCTALGTYVDMGVTVDITKYWDAETLADFDESVLGYMTLDNTLYGVPLFVTIQTLGGNKAMLEAAGVDVAKVQSEGWTYNEFLEAIKAGTNDETFGFVFANQGITTQDFVNIFGGVAGLVNQFTDDLKYAYTSENMLALLNAMNDIIRSGYMPDYTVAAGERLVMLQKGQTMVTGKAMPMFEGNCKTSSETAKDPANTEGFIEMEYVVLPMPVMDNVKPNCYGGAGALLPLRNANTTEEHMKNVCDFYYFLSSGAPAAAVCDACYMPALCVTGRTAQESTTIDQSEDNAIAAAYCTSLLKAPPAGVSADDAAAAAQVLNEVILPKVEALVAGEATPDEVYSAICDSAFELLGEENCETGWIA